MNNSPNTPKIDQAIKELMSHLEVEGEVTPCTFQDNIFTLDDGGEYLIVNKEDKEKALDENIRSTLWAFNANFLSDYINLDAECIKIIQEAKCEDCNDIFLNLLNDDLSHLIANAVIVDGAGHFLSSYDGAEISMSNDYYAYRIN